MLLAELDTPDMLQGKTRHPLEQLCHLVGCMYSLTSGAVGQHIPTQYRSPAGASNASLLNEVVLGQEPLQLLEELLLLVE